MIIRMMSAGGLTVRSITKSLLSGTSFQAAPSCCASMEFATSASPSSGVIARFTGGPKTEFMSGRFTTILGASGSVPMSMMETVSLPGAL